MTLRLEKHRAAVVGAGGAIGSAVCRAYAEGGAAVVAFDLNVVAAEAAVAGLPGEGHTSMGIDVRDPMSVEEASRDTWAVGPVDSVVYCAGVTFTADVTATDWGQYQELMAVNLDGAFYVGASFAQRMREASVHGSFAFVSSTAGIRGEAGASAYCASKFGLIGLVESFAAELAAFGIRVNAICPGNVDSTLLRAVARDVAARESVTAEEMLEQFAHAGAAQRLVAPEEVAGVALWLASPLATGVTGVAVRVDAGQLVG